jgi:hypothetical protein
MRNLAMLMVTLFMLPLLTACGVDSYTQASMQMAAKAMENQPKMLDIKFDDQGRVTSLSVSDPHVNNMPKITTPWDAAISFTKALVPIAGMATHYGVVKEVSDLGGIIAGSNLHEVTTTNTTTTTTSDVSSEIVNNTTTESFTDTFGSNNTWNNSGNNGNDDWFDSSNRDWSITETPAVPAP